MRRLLAAATVALVAALAVPALASAAPVAKAPLISKAVLGAAEDAVHGAAPPTNASCDPNYLHQNVAMLYATGDMQNLYHFALVQFGGFVPGGANRGVFFPGPTTIRSSSTLIQYGSATLVNANVPGPPVFEFYGYVQGTDCSLFHQMNFRVLPPYGNGNVQTTAFNHP